MELCRTWSAIVWTNEIQWVSVSVNRVTDIGSTKSINLTRHWSKGHSINWPGYSHTQYPGSCDNCLDSPTQTPSDHPTTALIRPHTNSTLLSHYCYYKFRARHRSEFPSYPSEFNDGTARRTGPVYNVWVSHLQLITGNYVTTHGGSRPRLDSAIWELRDNTPQHKKMKNGSVERIVNTVRSPW